MNAIKDAELIGEYSNEDHWLPRKRHLKVNKTFTYTQEEIGKKEQLILLSEHLTTPSPTTFFEMARHTQFGFPPLKKKKPRHAAR